MENTNDIVSNIQPPFEVSSGGSLDKETLTSYQKKIYDNALAYATKNNNPSPKDFAANIATKTQISYGKNNPFGDLATKSQPGTIKNGIKYRDYPTVEVPISKQYEQHIQELNNQQLAQEQEIAEQEEEMYNAEQEVQQQDVPQEQLQQEPQQYQQPQNNIQFQPQQAPSVYERNYSDQQVQNNNSTEQLDVVNPIQQMAMGGEIDPPKKLIYVDSKNDPRYRAYQDSLSLYNQSVDLKERLKPYFNTDAIKNKDKVLDILDDSKVYRNYNKTKNKPAISPINVSWSTGKPLLVNASGRMANNSNMSMASYPIYKKPAQPVEVQDIRKPNTTTGQWVKENGNKAMVLNQTFTSIKPKEKIIPLQQIQTKNLTSNNQETLTPITISRPTVQTPKSFNVDYSAQRMNDGKGYYDQNNVQNVNIQTAIRAKEHADKQNKYWQKKYGNSTHPNAIKRLKQLQDTAIITPQYAYGGYTNKSYEGGGHLNSYDVGGLHEENPFGGIPQGIGQNGHLNTTEQDETSFNINGKKFIFSNRIMTDGSIRNHPLNKK